MRTAGLLGILRTINLESSKSTVQLKGEFDTPVRSQDYRHLNRQERCYG
jgi:hypothetical protein